MSLDYIRALEAVKLDAVRLDVRRGLVLHLPFIERTGATVQDFSGQGNDGIICGWLSGWDQRIKLTLDSDDISGALTNFPVLVYLSDDSGIGGVDVSAVFDEVGANSLKIAITSADGETELYVEVEKWDNANEQAWLWVKVPSISATVDTIIYIYYDNDHANNTTYVGAVDSTPGEAVWDSNFERVWHLGESGNGTANEFKDSTDNDVHGQGGSGVGVNVPAQTAGKIGKGQLGDGTDFIDFGVTPDHASDNFTIETWIKFSEGDIVGFGIVEKSGEYVFITLDGGGGAAKSFARLYLSGGANFYPGHFCGDDAWHYIAITCDRAGNLICYMDAETPVSTNISGDSGETLPTGGALKVMGTDWGTIIGKQDEVRISDKARAPEWIGACYETQRDDLITFGSEVLLTTYQNAMRALGKMGIGGILDGVTNCVSVADADSLSFASGGFSVSAWINMTDASNFWIVNKDDYPTAFGREYNLLVSGADKLVVYLLDHSTGGNIGRLYNTAVTSYEGIWIHVVMTYDGSGTSSGVKLYLNAERVDDTDNESGSFTAMENKSSRLEIGCRGLNEEFAEGKIDDVRLYSVELIGDEVRQLYKMGRV